jgi:hypothetical protein
VGKPEGKIPLGKATHRWENNIKMNLQAMRWEGMDWIDWLRIGTGGGLSESSRKPLGTIKFREFLD